MTTSIILANGFLKVAIWTIGLGFAYYHRRGMLVAGFALAIYASAVRALNDAGEPHSAAVDLAALAGTAVAGLFVASFVFAQFRHGARPRRWAP